MISTFKPTQKYNWKRMQNHFPVYGHHFTHNAIFFGISINVRGTWKRAI